MSKFERYLKEAKERTKVYISGTKMADGTDVYDHYSSGWFKKAFPKGTKITGYIDSYEITSDTKKTGNVVVKFAVFDKEGNQKQLLGHSASFKSSDVHKLNKG